jgi:VWFA-related protein
MTSFRPHPQARIAVVGASVAVWLALVPAGAFQSADQQAGPRAKPTWRTQSEVITLAATVTDASGHLVPDLKVEDFVLFEDGVEQTITQFVGERVPVSLGMLLDISESMIGRRMDDARFAISRFLQDLLVEDDEVFLTVFNHRPRVLEAWTQDRARLGRALEPIVPTGGTSIYDALMSALPLFAQRANQRAAIVLISDGADTASDHDIKQVRTELRRNDAFVYALAIDAPGRRPVSGRVDPYALRDLTDDSGGYTEVVHDSADLVAATARIADELNHQYLLGYAAPRGPDRQYHSIRLRTRDPGYRVRTRKGYVASVE